MGTFTDNVVRWQGSKNDINKHTSKRTFFTFIKQNNINEVNTIVNKIEMDEKKLLKIKDLVKKIENINSDNYKYGSGWIDEWFLKNNIKKINNILSEYYIVVV